MKCEDCLAILEDYFDGELPPEDRARVSAHVASCRICAARHRELTDEQELYSRYNREVEVTQALWSSVRSRIVEERCRESQRKPGWLRDLFFPLLSAKRFSLPLTAALVLAAVGLTTIVMKYMNQPSTVAVRAPVIVEQPRGQVEEHGDAAAVNAEANGAQARAQNARAVEQTGSNRSAPVAQSKAMRAQQRAMSGVRAQTPDELVREAEQKYITAIQILSRDINRRRSRLDPETLARFDQTLAAIDRTIAGTRRAVREHPGDPVAVQYMLTAYAKKVDVLREMGGY